MTITIPAMPEALPSFIELMTSRSPDAFKPAVASAIFPPLSVYAEGLSVEYIDNTKREFTFMNVLMAPTGAGKAAIDEPIRQILADVQKRDDKNREREAKWKEVCESLGASKKRPARPTDLCIQVIAPDTTFAAFMKRMLECNGKYLYTKVNEIEDLCNMRNGSGRNYIYQLILNAFDNARVGQERVGMSSVSARPQMRWAFNAATTEQKGMAFFRGQATTGALARVSLSTIEVPRFAPMPIYGNYDDEFATRLAVYIERLKGYPRGLVVCREAEELVRGIIGDVRDNAMATNNEAYFELSKRAAVIAYLKAMVLYIIEGGWSELIADYVQWSFEYDMSVKMKYFGAEAQRDFTAVSIAPASVPTSLIKLDELPQIFTREDYLKLRESYGQNIQGDVYGTIRSWKHRGYIIQNDDGTYCKLVGQHL